MPYESLHYWMVTVLAWKCKFLNVNKNKETSPRAPSLYFFIPALMSLMLYFYIKSRRLTAYTAVRSHVYGLCLLINILTFNICFL